MAIVDFIMSHYIAIIIVVMIVIFALIGKYVEKVGFFEQAPDKKTGKKVMAIEEDLTQPLPPADEPKKAVETAPQKAEETKDVSIEDIDKALFAPIEGNSEYDELNKQVKDLLPRKDVIDDDLLSDIDNLSLDKTQKYNFGDIPDLDDVILPEIKKSDEDEDIWKF